jgi:class 3 adenylate cyclase
MTEVSPVLVFLFTDIEGSTRLWEQHTDLMGAVIDRHDAMLRERIGACGGRITKYTGDGVTAAFEGAEPLVSALEIQKQCAEEAWGAIGKLCIRVALHAGEAELHSGDYHGPAVNCTSRILDAGWGGQILLTPQVTNVCPLPPQAAVRDLGTHLLRDVTALQQIYQLTHPELSRQEFPPLRTLSSSAIERTVAQQGQRLANLDAPAIGAGLVSAALLPVIQGDLTSTSPALAANLGLLADMGAVELQSWLGDFVERVRSRQQAGETITEMQIGQQLEQELLRLWEAEGDTAAVLRADASRLLEAVQGVEAVRRAAADDVKERLTWGLSVLAANFGEFRWMLDGLGQTLAEVQARQALQLAMQAKQLDLQQQQLDKTDLILRQQEGAPALQVPSESGVALLARRLKQRDLAIMDRPSLAALYAARDELDIGPQAAEALLRSALHHDVDIQPWVERLGSPEEGVRALEDALEHYPKPQAHLRIVEGLESLQGDAATEALLRMARTEQMPVVRARAALAAVQKGHLVETMASLTAGLDGPNQATALAALAEVADVVGIPEGLGSFPRMQVFLSLAWRRWRASRDAILRQTVRATVGGMLMFLFGCCVPLFYYLAVPEAYYAGVADMGLAAWVFSGAMMFLLIGEIHGSASGFILGVVDALCHDIGHGRLRLLLGLGSGLPLAGWLVLLTFLGLVFPDVGAAVFIPVYVFYGLGLGAASALVIPPLGTNSSVHRQLTRAAAAIAVAAPVTALYVYLVYPTMVVETLPNRLIFAIVYSLAMALVFVRRTEQVPSR